MWAYHFIISKKSVDKEKVLELSKKIYEIFESEQALYKGIVEDLGLYSLNWQVLLLWQASWVFIGKQ